MTANPRVYEWFLWACVTYFASSLFARLAHVTLGSGVLRRQPHRCSGLANLPSVGAVP